MFTQIRAARQLRLSTPGLLIVLGAVLGAGAQHLFGAPPVTNINIGTQVVQPGVKRLGINLGSPDFYDSGQIMKNLIFGNEGFEGLLYQAAVSCASGTPTSCVDADQYSAWRAGFWNNASFEVIWGAAKGRTGTVAQTLAPTSSQGVTLQFSASGKAPAPGDWIVLRRASLGNPIAGWWPSNNGTSATFGVELKDLPPNNPGKECLSVNASGSGQATLNSNFDTSPLPRSFVQLRGPHQVSFQAKSKGGSTTLTVGLARLTNPNVTYLSQAVTLTNQWATYTLPFTGADNGLAIGPVQLSFNLSGGSMLIDTVSVTATAGDSTNTSAFRDPVVSALRQLNPGLLRYWSGQLGDTLDNQLQTEFQRQRSGYSAFDTGSNQIQIGLHDFLVLCQVIGAEPWYVMPITLSTTEMTDLIQYLQGDASTPYGAKRAALGQSLPWTSVFPKIHLEFGNEAWNNTFTGGIINDPVAYGGRAAELFQTARAYPGFLTNSYDLVVNGQAVNPGLNQSILGAASGLNSLAIAPYQMYQVSNYANNQQLYGPTFAEPQWDVSPAGITGQNWAAAKAAGVALGVYEVNLSTTGGTIDQATLASFTPSLGAGIAVAENMMLMLQMGVQNQMLFALPQFQFQASSGNQARLWGSVIDMGVTNRRRPQYWAVKLANEAISGDLMETTQTGANPTWQSPALNGIPATTVQTILSFAFSQTNGTQAVLLFNLDLANPQDVTFSGPSIPAGAVQVTQLASANLSDNNETNQVVGLTNTQLTNFSPASPLSLPPHSMTVLRWGRRTCPGGRCGADVQVKSVLPGRPHGK